MWACVCGLAQGPPGRQASGNPAFWGGRHPCEGLLAPTHARTHPHSPGVRGVVATRDEADAATDAAAAVAATAALVARGRREGAWVVVGQG